MVSALMMWRRLLKAVRRAYHEENFAPVAHAALGLVAVGTATYSLGNGWNVIDGFYFAVATLTTSSIADPDLVLDDRWLKVFTVFYVLVGIGVLVELGRRLAMGFVAVSKEDRDDKRAQRAARRAGSGESG